MTTMTAATPAPASPSTLPIAPAPTAAATDATSTDFLLMLGQLVAGGEAPAVNAAICAAPVQMEMETDEPEAETPSVDAFAMLPLPLPLPTAPAPAPVAAKSHGADMIAELQLSRQKAMEALIPRLPQESEALQELTTAPQSMERVDAPTSFDNALALQTNEKSLHAPRASIGESSRPVHTPVGSSAWADEIGSRVTMMAKQGEQTASLRLSPEHLGPLEIRVAIRDEQASVWFGAAHADTRAAIENALPRLRELFEAQGMSLTDAGVYREPPRDQATQASTSAHTSDDAPVEAQPIAARTILGLVDAYA